MGTRLFCDHCGNTVRVPHVMSFGPLAAIQEQEHLRQQYQHMQRMQNAGMQAGPFPLVGQQIQPMPPQPTSPTLKYPMTSVDLCDACLPIWFARVSNITKGSDPEK